MIPIRPFALLWLLIMIAIALPMSAFAASTDDASKYIDSLATRTLDTIADSKLNKDQKEDALEKLFSSNVDIAWVGRFVMGRSWNQATDDQKKRYLPNYQTFIIRHYASRFTDYTSGSFKITSSRDDGDDEFTVGMQIQTADKSTAPVQVDYRIRKDKNSFKIFDIIVEGVSMINTQRSEFGAVINDKGIDYLISQLEAKSAKPAPEQ